jgi:hypothetical protein
MGFQICFVFRYSDFGFSCTVRSGFPPIWQLEALACDFIAMALDEDFAHQAADPDKCQRHDDLNDFRRHAWNSIVWWGERVKGDPGIMPGAVERALSHQCRAFFGGSALHLTPPYGRVDGV